MHMAGKGQGDAGGDLGENVGFVGHEEDGSVVRDLGERRIKIGQRRAVVELRALVAQPRQPEAFAAPG